MIYNVSVLWMMILIYLEEARGCEDKWECCEQAPEEKGCQTVCSRCQVRWGRAPGCCWPEVDDDNEAKSPDAIDEEKTTDYDEANNPTIKDEIAQEAQDKLDAEATPAPPLGDVPERSPDPQNASTDDLL